MKFKFLLLAFLIGMSVKSFSQKNIISLNLKDATIERTLLEIEKQSEYRFFFEQSSIDLQPRVSIQIKDATINDVLDKLFKNTPYSYQIVDRHIILSQTKKINDQNLSPGSLRIVKGTVTNKAKESIPGVTVMIKNTNAGTITDRNGFYKLEIPAEFDSLTFSYVGMKRQDVALGKNSQVDVILEPEIFGVDEVIVVGYGDQKKSDLTGSIASIEVEATKRMPVAGIDQALQGRAPGVFVTSTSGSPGGGTTVRIRGIGTVNNNNPLFVIDGVPTDDIRFLNTGDIDNIEVLKDASASAIYGNRGANGVILINTKKGKPGRPKIQYDSYIGFNEAWKNPSLGNSNQFAALSNLAVKNGIESEGVGAYQYVEDFKNPETFSGGTNWWKLITQKAPVQNHNLSISGGNDLNKYMMSLSYLSQDGTIRGSEFNRITFRINNEYALSEKISLAFNTNFSQAIRKLIPEDDLDGGIVFTSIVLDPITSGEERPVNDPIRMKYGEFSRWYESKYSNKYNPVAQIGRNFNRWDQIRFFGNLLFDYKILKRLNYHSSFGIDIRQTETNKFYPTYWMDADSKNDINSVSKDTGRNKDWVFENTLTYKTLENRNHMFSVMTGMTMEYGKYETVLASKRNVPNNINYLRYLSAATSDANIESSVSDYALISFINRVNYSYRSRYMLTASIRADGSSKFATGEQWGYFPSVSGGWRISSEKFFSALNHNGIFDDLKIRLGWGQVGNQNISDNSFRTIIAGGVQNRYIFDKTIYQGYSPSNVGNKHITWETTESTNLGFDFVMFKNKLSGNVDFFNKQTKKMLLELPVPSSIGLPNSPWTNAGDVENKGVEIYTNYHNKWKELNFNVSVNISTYRNKILSLGGGEPIMGGEQRLGYTTKTMVGHPIGAFFGYVVEGVFQNQKEVDDANALTSGHGYYQDVMTRPGDFKFKDLNGDGRITGEDRTFIGSPHPDFTYGISLSAEYHQIDFSVFLQGCQGGDIFNVFKYYTHQNTGYFNAPADMLQKAWHGEGTSNSQFQVSASTANNNLRASTWYVEDGSFLRVKNLQLGYNFNKRICQRIGISECRVYIGGQNLYTFTRYSGLDPELADLSGNPLNSGIDFAKYPQARTILGGVSIKF
ncbi:MAG TPA: TonB-dependent receptor [Prolixibacteraceae bacterium]|nr:TonB-dependent receptor [Prolixibacteraceae bacterium]